MERSSEEGSPARNKTPEILNSTQLSRVMAKETKTISVASPESQLVTVESDSIEPTIPYGLGNQHPIVPFSLNDVNLPPNPFNKLATIVVVQPDEKHSPISSKLSNLSPISTPPMNSSTMENWETPHTSTDEKTFFSEDEPKQVYWHISSSETSDSSEPQTSIHHFEPFHLTAISTTTKEDELSMRVSSPKNRRVSKHTCEAFRQPLPVRKTP